MASIHIAEDFTLQISEIISPNAMKSGGLYLGNFAASQNEALLKKYRITAIISILSQKQVKITLKNVTHLKISIDDSPFENIGQHFSCCIDFITKNCKTGNVFVHCVAGISRSASIVIAYLMKTRKYSLQYALNKVKRRRNVVNPNKGFLSQLTEFQKTLQKNFSLKSK